MCYSSAKVATWVIWELCPNVLWRLLEENEQVYFCIKLCHFLFSIGYIYLKSILHDCRNGEWGDHVTLQAAADSVWFLSILVSDLLFLYLFTLFAYWCNIKYVIFFIMVLTRFMLCNWFSMLNLFRSISWWFLLNGSLESRSLFLHHSRTHVILKFFLKSRGQIEVSFCANFNLFLYACLNEGFCDAFENRFTMIASCSSL